MKAIVAISENNVIGKAGGLPWHLPEDLQWFKKCTMGGIMLMGRKTLDELGGMTLPGREAWVLSSKPGQDEPGKVRWFTHISSVATAMALERERTVWLTGGGQLYRALLSACDELYLTRVKRHVEGDTFFPELDERWQRREIVQETDELRIEIWENRQVEALMGLIA